MRRPSVVSLLRQRVTGRLHLGLLRAGDRLPSVRALARELVVDPRVVLAGYQALETEGLIELRPRSGVFVAVQAASGIRAPEHGIVATGRRTEWLIDRLAESLAAGIAAPMFLEQARRALDTLRLRAVVLDRNDDQLWSTADELRRDYGFETDVIDLDQIRKRVPLPSVIRRADLLVTASSDASIRTIAHAVDVPLLEVTMCPDLFAEVRRLLRNESVYFVVADPRFALKLETLLAPARGQSRLRTMTHNRDDLRQIPPRAPVYLTRLVRERMTRNGAPHERLVAEEMLLNRVMPDARVFSAESARELLAFVVRANLAARALSGDDASSLLDPSVARSRSAATQ